MWCFPKKWGVPPTKNGVSTQKWGFHRKKWGGPRKKKDFDHPELCVCFILPQKWFSPPKKWGFLTQNGVSTQINGLFSQKNEVSPQKWGVPPKKGDFYHSELFVCVFVSLKKWGFPTKNGVSPQNWGFTRKKWGFSPQKWGVSHKKWGVPIKGPTGIRTRDLLFTLMRFYQLNSRYSGVLPPKIRVFSSQNSGLFWEFIWFTLIK